MTANKVDVWEIDYIQDDEDIALTIRKNDRNILAYNIARKDNLMEQVANAITYIHAHSTPGDVVHISIDGETHIHPR
jgi:hypothetical protein